MKTYDKQEQQKEQGRILARLLARELTKEELKAVAGGYGRYRSSSAWSCSGAGDGDDGGADD